MHNWPISSWNYGMRVEFNSLLNFFHLGDKYLGAHSDWSGADMVQVSANLDVGNASRRKIHPRRPTGRISPALRCGGSISSLSALPNYRMSTPRLCRFQMMFARADVMAWMGDNMGKGIGDWLGKGQNYFVHSIYGEDDCTGVSPRQWSIVRTAPWVVNYGVWCGYDG